MEEDTWDLARYGMRKTATCGFLSDGASAISARKSRGKCATSHRGKTAGKSGGRAGEEGQGVEKDAVETRRRLWWLRGGKVGARMKEGPKDPHLGGGERERERRGGCEGHERMEKKERKEENAEGLSFAALQCTLHPA